MNHQFDALLYRSGLIAQGCWDELDIYDKTAIEELARLVVLDAAHVIEYLVSMRIPASEYSTKLREYFGVS